MKCRPTYMSARTLHRKECTWIFIGIRTHCITLSSVYYAVGLHFVMPIINDYLLIDLLID